jgi:hypothetical protein
MLATNEYQHFEKMYTYMARRTICSTSPSQQVKPTTDPKKLHTKQP